MVRRFEEKKKISIADYKSNQKNAGKVAIFDFAHSFLVAEGDRGSDWMELELLCEELRKNGDFRIVIVPEAQPTVKVFRRVMV